MTNITIGGVRWGLTAAFLLLLPLFFLKYVPLISPFLALVLGLSGVIFGVTLYRQEWGLVLFVFLFPLVNNWPYFWGIDLNVPHAPVAIVLFLIFFLGWLIRAYFRQESLWPRTKLNSPLKIVAAMIIVSGIITFFRMTAFFPFLADSLYEFKTNVSGVTTGGAVMSTLFSGLNYLAGFAFFLIIYQVVQTQPKKKSSFIMSLLIALTAAAIIASLFGLFQRFHDPSFGNTAFWVTMKQINSTFKDPNAVAFFLSGLIPLLLGLVLNEKSFRKLFFLLGLLLSLLVFPFVGSRSAFLGLLVALGIFFILRSKPWRLWFKERFAVRPALRPVVISGLIILLISLLTGGFVVGRRTRLFQRLNQSFTAAFKARSLSFLSPERYFLWRGAGLMLKDYPLSGVGLGAYIIELPNYYVLYPSPKGKGFEVWQRNDSAENYFLHAGAEMGLITLVFFSWLFWLIFRQARRVYQSSQEEPAFSGGEVKIGLIAGLAACIVNYLFHSYIGSFESKFFFWFLVALLFVIDLKGEERGEVAQIGSNSSQPKRKRKVQYALITGAILVFSGTSFWSATHSLSLKAKTDKLNISQEFGWYGWEKDQAGHEFQWSRQYGGRMIKVDQTKLKFNLLASHPDIQQKPVRVKVFLIRQFFQEKILLTEFILSQPQWETRILSLPAKLKGEKVIILFKVNRTWVPFKRTGAPDPRRLGVAVTKFKFLEGSS